VAHEESERLANDLSGPLVIVASIEAMLPGRMIEHPEIDASLSSFPHERIGPLKKSDMVAARAREQEWR
jgi:hypothetical protein